MAQSDTTMATPPNLLPVHTEQGTAQGTDQEGKEVEGLDTPSPSMVQSALSCIGMNIQANPFSRRGTVLKILRIHSTGTPIENGSMCSSSAFKPSCRLCVRVFW